MSELIGAIVGNRYRLSAPWTHADVYRARDLQLERNVAITIARTYDETRATPALFEVRQTAQLAARLSHPNILEVLDFGQEGELCYLVTPLAEGGSLRDRLSGKPLPLDAVTRILQPLTDALSWAHSRQPSIVHGNLTPDHILFTQDERMLLSGVGSMGNASSSPLGDITALTTAPEYLSPEQADGALADAHSDIYALGIILYELLDGAAPFRGASPAQTFELHRHAPLPPLSQRNPAVTQQVEWIIARALAKRPADRFASVSELWAHWQAAVATHPSTFLPVPTASVLPVPASPTSPIAQPFNYPAMQQPIYPTTRSFKWVWLPVAASLGVFVLMVGLGLWLRRPLSPSVVAVPTPTLSPQVEIAYQQGIIYLNDGKPELALIEFEKVLVPAPNYKDTVVRRQEACRQSEAKEEERKAQQDLKIGKFCEAADRLQKLRYEPSVNQTLVVDDLFKAYRECSRLRLAQNDVKSALSQMDNALSLPNRSEDAEARAQKKLLEDYQGSLVAFKAGQWDETITNLEPLIEQLPSLARETLAQAYLNRGRQTRAGGALEHYEQAIADLERAEAYWPAHVEIKTELGESRAALFKLYVGEARQLLAAGECATMGRVREMLDKAKTLNPIAPELAELEAPLEKLGGVTVVEVANSRRDFSGTQGGRGWSYLVVGGAGQIQPINFWDEATQEWYTFHRWVRIGASDAHPGYQPASNSSDVIRRWRSSVNGRVRIYVTAYKLDTGTPTTFGDGVVVYIKHRGTSIWSGYIAPRNAVGVRGWLAVTRDVAVGDNLDFGLAPFRDASHDHTLFEISIRWEKPGCAG